MKKIESVTLEEWIEAEGQAAHDRAEPRPLNSITSVEYAVATQRSSCAARVALNNLVVAGRAEKRRWRNGTGGCTHVYILHKNGKR